MSSSQAFPPMDVTDSGEGIKPNRRVAYFYDPDVGNYTYGLGHPMKPHRIRMAHNLIVNYGLCDEISEDAPDSVGEGAQKVNNKAEGFGGIVSEVNGNGNGNGHSDGSEARWQKAIVNGARGKAMQVFRPRRATRSDMTRFHSDEYIDFLAAVTPETADAMSGGGVRCLTGEDCPAWEGLFEYCSISAGGSIGAAERLNSGQADIAINWAGGLHHAKKTEASGFCYVNDIVLGILELLRIHPRVLYIDVDVHHGDGVEEAFYTTDRVMTASFHRFGEFFPGTGDVRDIGMKRGKGYAVNVPLRDGMTDESFHSVFKPVIQHIIDWYRPGAIVLQMGADSLAGDKLGGFNITLDGHSECARYVKSFNLPVMMVGGGGYTTKNVARAWTLETAVMCGRELPEDLPYNQYMEYYGPRFKLEVLKNNMDNHNTTDYLERIKTAVIENLRELPHAPGVQMRSVPSKRLSQALGFSKDGYESEPEDELDARLKKIMRIRKNNASYDPGSDSDDDPANASSEEDAAAYAQPKRARRQGGTGLQNAEASSSRRSIPSSRPSFKSHTSSSYNLTTINSSKTQLNGFTHPQSRGRREESELDDTIQVRKKRNFFSTSGEEKRWLNIKAQSGLVDGVANGHSAGGMTVSTGLASQRPAIGGIGIGVGGGNGVVETWNGNGNGVGGMNSRAGSPMSVV